MSQTNPSISTASVNRHALTAVEKQRSQVEKLLKDPAKPAYIPPPPKEKTIRPAREMMKNVQGSSAGAGSGEFHVYKASRRREYERLKLLEEASTNEIEEAEFEKKRRAMEEVAEAKTAKNRAKRQKKKERLKAKLAGKSEGDVKIVVENSAADLPIKKRRLVIGKELVFKKPGETVSDDNDPDEDASPSADDNEIPSRNILGFAATVPRSAAETGRITIVEDD
ncbi:DUF1168-domain-containing protein [Pholiota conissans]|uniref:DUF1168-domain-containing protein n=1 Tax=Pholiota conissans TaxID=109636 RepID=A0A9P5YXH4_9AGAR|nr:DUF1168-domain-containing protein [Pholiota conissans]